MANPQRLAGPVMGPKTPIFNTFCAWLGKAATPRIKKSTKKKMQDLLIANPSF
jgi:hypothetical protein